ncbi:MAG: site-specific integrase [Anaerolineales bacterium]|nr:site-specific integrase [Anaerolineales bacterium]
MARKNRGRNEGSLHQRPNGTWRAQLSVNGKRVSKGFKNKADAQSWLRDFQVKIFQGLDYKGSLITLEEYLHQWLENYSPSLRDKTADQYSRTIKKHINPYLGKTPLKDLSLARIEQFYATLVQNNVGIRTVRLSHVVLHRSLDKAVRYGLLTHNPTQGATLPRYRHGDMKVLDESQVSRFLVAARYSTYQGLYHLAVTTGMRLGELVGLKWSDVYFNTGAITVQRQVQDVRGQGWTFQEPKTRSGRRTVKVGEGCLQSLRIQLEKQQNQKALVGERWQEFDLVFTSKVGTPIDPSNLRLDFKKVLHQAGLPQIRFHDLRHTAASLMLNRGIPFIVVSRILGHSKPSITLDIYGHLLTDMLDEAARIMDEVVTPIRVEIKKSVEKS